MLTLAEFQTNAYLVSRNNAAIIEKTYGNHKRELTSQTFGHTITPANFPNVKSINITAGVDTVFLPYYQDKVASVRVPTAGPSVFITDNMSGCALYLGKTGNGTLVAFHANSQTGSSEAEMAGKPPSHQSRAAVTELDGLVKTAGLNYSHGVTVVNVLSKSRYLARVDKLAATSDKFLGGTTIAGFRTGTTWEFWFQNFGSANGGAVGLLHCEKFYTTT